MNYINKYLFKIITIISLSISSSFAATNDPQGQLPSYKLGPGDLLEISVWKEEGLQKQVLVKPDGGISFPLVGEVKAGGKTTGQLEKTIVSKLKKYIPDPVVSVSVMTINNNKIYVIGKVARSGEFVATRYVDVMQALAMAGGLNAYASSNDIKILRRVNGKERAYPFEYDAVASGKNLGQNILLKAGDVVVVP